MNIVRSCFAASALLLSFRLVRPNSIVFETTVESLEVNRTTCCPPPGHVGGDTVCKYGNETFHSIEIIGSSGFQSCPKPYGSGADALQLVRKCCPPDQTYYPETLSCQAVENGQGSADDFPWLMMKILLLLDRIQDTVTVVGYEYEPAVYQDCNISEMLIVDINSTAIWPLLSEDHYCFDVTQPPELQLVALMCPEKSSRNTCFNKSCRDKEMNGSKRTDYCLEYYSQNGSNSKKVTAIACASPANSWGSTESPKPQDDEKSNQSKKADIYTFLPSWNKWLIPFGVILSIVCLFVTLIIFFMIPNLRKVHGYYVMCYIVCLFLSFVCLLIIQWLTDVMGSSLCKFFGYITLFSFLATLCWLNVICFDFFWILRYNESINKTSLKRSVIYNIYSWGFSSTWAFTAFISQHSGYTGLSEFSIHFRNRRYWLFKDDYGSFNFFILPSSIMLIVNLILFGLTAVDLSRKMLLNKFEQTDSKTRRFKLHMEKFAMSMKLFLVTGIPWSLIIISKIFENDLFICHIFDGINVLQGVMVFVLFMVQPEVITRLQKKAYSIKTPSHEERCFGDHMDTEFDQLLCDTDDRVWDMTPSHEESLFGDTA